MHESEWEARESPSASNSADALAFLESLQADAPLAIGFIDRSFRYVYVNEALANSNGRSVSEHIGRTVAEVVPTLWSALGPLCQQVLDTGDVILNTEVTGAITGEHRDWATTLYPVRTGGFMAGIGVLVTDITERKQAQRAREDLLRATVAALASTVETRDPYTAGHQRRVAALSAAVASELGLDDDSVDGIRLAASVHDIGKLGVPAAILSRPGRLRRPEYELIQSHPRAGYEIMAGINFPWPVAQMVGQHHERLDGSGYPDGLRGEEISLGARIIAVTDSVEAMASHRPYRAALGVDVALNHVEAGRGTRFDPGVVDATVDLFRTTNIGLES